MKHYLQILITTLCVLIGASSAIAQSNYEDVVYLKNGSIIRGIITEQIPNESVKIQTKDKNVFVYKMDEISKITKEEIAKPAPERESRRSRLVNGERKKNGSLSYTIPKYGFNINFLNKCPDFGCIFQSLILNTYYNPIIKQQRL